MVLSDEKFLASRTGVVERCLKELQYYLKEEASHRETIDQLKAEDASTEIIKKQLEALNDTVSVIPECYSRLETFYRELADFLATPPNVEGEPGQTQVDKAKAVLQKVLEVRPCLAVVEDTKSDGDEVY